MLMGKAIRSFPQELQKLWISNDVEQTDNKQTFPQAALCLHFTIITTGHSSSEKSYQKLGICTLRDARFVLSCAEPFHRAPD